MKAKVKNWLKQLNNGIVIENTTKVIYQIHTQTLNGIGYTTVYDLRNDLNIAHQTLTSILSMIQDEGIIKCIGEVEINKCHYSKLVYSDKIERENLILIRRKEKLSQWIKRGKKEWLDLMPESLINELNNLT
jgi:hypothetical protein